MSASESSSGGIDPMLAEDVLDEVLRAPAEVREAEIDRRCAGDEALAREVRSLLRHLPDP